MPFGNPVVGGIELIRNAISSSNYVQGIAGWLIGKDGTAEFDSISARQNMSAAEVDAAKIVYNGTDLATTLAGFSRGSVAQYANSGIATAGIGTTEVGLIEVTGNFVAGRFYMLFPQVTITYSATNAQSDMRIRESHNADGSPNPPPVGITSPAIYGRQFSDNAPSGYGKILESWGWWVPNVTGTYRLLLTVGARLTGTTVSVVEDSGFGTIPPPNIFILDTVQQSVSFGQANAGGATTTPKTRFTKQYGYTSVQTFQSSGARATVTGNNTLGYQGYFSDGNGDKEGMFFFNYAAIAADLAGSTIIGSRVYLHNVHTYFNNGGTALVGYHNNAPVPASGFTNIALRQWSMFQAKGGDGWVDSGTLLGTQLRDGGAQGIIVGYAGNLDQQYYMTFDNCIIEVTYDK